MAPTEAQFLEDIRKSRESTELREQYADWLEAQGEVDKAGFLRAQVAMITLSTSDPGFHDAAREVTRLIARTDTGWRARVAQTSLTNCYSFLVKCPRRWDSLDPTDNPTVRNCDACRRQVHYCLTQEDLSLHAAAGDCVVVDLALDTRPLVPEPTMGVVMRPQPEPVGWWGRLKARLWRS